MVASSNKLQVLSQEQWKGRTMVPLIIWNIYYTRERARAIALSYDHFLKIMYLNDI